MGGPFRVHTVAMGVSGLVPTRSNPAPHHRFDAMVGVRVYYGWVRDQVTGGLDDMVCVVRETTVA